jgi:FkbM family methyltransferase
MNTLQKLVYASKSPHLASIMLPATKFSKEVAGFYFDIFVRSYRVDGMAFQIPANLTTRAMRGKFLVDTYELSERELTKRHLPRDSTVLELGGCIGVVSCVANRLLSNPTHHVVVEANPFLIPTLTANRDANSAAFNIENCVISDEPVAKLAVSRNMDSSSLGQEGISIATTSISALEEKYGLIFDAMIMDVEGAEYDILMKNNANLKNMNCIIVELHPETLGESKIEELQSLLRSVGLQRVGSMLTVEVWTR